MIQNLFFLTIFALAKREREIIVLPMFKKEGEQFR